jgi:lysine decarboxylase
MRVRHVLAVPAHNLTVVPSAAPRRSERRADATSPSPVGAALHHPGTARHRYPGSSAPSLAELVDDDSAESGAVGSDRDPEREALATTENALAQLWGAELAVLVGSGTPTATQALLLARTGDEVLMARDVPVSSQAALILAGANPVWVTPRVEGRCGLGTGIDPADVAAALAEHPQVRTLHVASPSYTGVCSDLVGLRAVTDQHGVALVVDESWGPQLHWHPHLGASGVSAGADAVITSAQQLIAATPPLSLLVLRGDAFDVTRVAQAVRMAEPEVPVVPLDAQNFEARQRLAQQLVSRVTRSVEVARLARSMLARVPGVHVLSAADLALPVDRLDPCTIVLEVNGRGLDGSSAERLMLENHGIRVDGADARHLYLVIGPEDDVAAVRRLVIAVASLGSWTGPARRKAPDPLAILPTPGEQAITPRDAWYAPAESVRIERSVGRICAELVTPYPPGIALAGPGEVLTTATVAWLLEAVACRMHIRGPSDPSLTTLRVVVRDR